MKKKILLAILAVLIIAAIPIFNLPQRFGLAKSPAEKLLEPRLNESIARTMKQELAAAGVNTQGMEIYVIPYKDSNENLAVVVLDSSQGFDINNFSQEDAITEYLEMLARLDEEGGYNVKRVAVDYKNENGKSLLKLTAPTDTINSYSDGSISRQQFLSELEGEVNFVEVAKLLSEELR